MSRKINTRVSPTTIHTCIELVISLEWIFLWIIFYMNFFWSLKEIGTNMMFHKLFFVVTHNVSVLLCSDIRSIFKNCKELHWYKNKFKCILVQTLTVSAQENVFVSCLLFIFRADLSVYPYPVLGYMQRNLCSHHRCTKVFAFSFDFVL